MTAPKVGFVEFRIECLEMGYKRSHYLPLRARGRIMALSDDLERAIEFYSLWAENQELQNENQQLKQDLEILNGPELPPEQMKDGMKCSECGHGWWRWDKCCSNPKPSNEYVGPDWKERAEKV